jgi:hypothetical protein
VIRRFAASDFAVQPVQQRDQSTQLATGVRQQPLDGRFVDGQAASQCTLAQHRRPPFLIQRLQQHAHALAQPRAQVRQHQAQFARRLLRRVQHGHARSARTVVEIEQRDLVLAVAGNLVQAVQRHQFARFQPISAARTAGGAGQRHVGRQPSGLLGAGAHRQRLVGLAGSRRTFQVDPVVAGATAIARSCASAPSGAPMKVSRRWSRG